MLRNQIVPTQRANLSPQFFVLVVVLIVGVPVSIWCCIRFGWRELEKRLPRPPWQAETEMTGRGGRSGSVMERSRAWQQSVLAELERGEADSRAAAVTSPDMVLAELERMAEDTVLSQSESAAGVAGADAPVRQNENREPPSQSARHKSNE